jgi:hydroxyquinol 1,2-dioxygenase
MLSDDFRDLVQAEDLLMRTVNSNNVTDTVLGYLGEDTDPRLREVLEGLVSNLHRFVRDARITHDEWAMAIDFLKRTGDITDDKRNEFILLSDVLGVSSLVDMINSRPPATSCSTLGPFHIAGTPVRPMGADLKGNFEAEVLLVEGRVRDTDNNPISGAKVDVWQNAPNGMYSSQDTDQDTYSFHGVFVTDENGRYAFTTAQPIAYTVPTDGPAGEILNATGRDAWRPAHLHYMVLADGYQPLVTEAFPDDDPYLDKDAVLGVREDLVFIVKKQSANSFPEGFELSGNVDEPYARIEFDLVLSTVG